MAIDWRTADRWLMGEAMTNTLIASYINTLCDDIGTRWGGTDAERSAADFIVATQEKHGLKDARTEEFQVRTWENPSASITVLAAAGQGGEAQWEADVRPCLFCPPVNVTGPLVDVGYGMEHEIEAVSAKLKGAIVIMSMGFEPFTPPRLLSLRLEDMKKLGATVVISPNTEGGRRMNHASANDWRDGESDCVPVPWLQTSREHGAKLRRRASQGRRATVKVTARLFDATSRNTVCELPGSLWPDEHIILGAHHDTTPDSPGSNDNGSGSSVTLETARLLAALNHPHIAAIYGVEEADGVLGLVLELVDGETLHDRLKKGPLPVSEALAIARQIADALEAAHEQGIVHRDLKPANVKVRTDGTVKVLDFGLAKALGDDVAVDPSLSPTLTAMAMRTGLILGTAAYMSPEQARGQTVDKRTDIWAFGCVLYEMLTGHRAFEGDGITEVLVSVLEKEPDWTRLPARLPAPIGKLLRRCLEKDRRQRLPDIGVARQELEELQNTKGDAEFAPSASVTRGAGVRRTTSLALAILAAIVISAITTWMVTRPSPSRAVRLEIALPTTDGLPGLNALGPGPVTTLSPDGRTLVYVATRNGVDQLYRRSLDHLEAEAIPATQGARHPFFSPDSQWVGFLADRQLKKISLAGGPAVTICNIPGNFGGADWGADDRIVFGHQNASVPEQQGLALVPAAGGVPTSLITYEKGETAHRWPHFLPDGDGIVFTSFVPKRGAQLEALSLKTKERRTLLRGTSPRYSPTGHLLFVRNASLWAVLFDTEHLSVTGDPVRIVEGVKVWGWGGGDSEYALAGNGTLAYMSGPNVALADVNTLVWVDREGREEALPAPPRPYVAPRISPNGTKVAVTIFETEQERDIWIWDVAGQVLTRLTFDPGPETSPVWTPDGRRVAFAARDEKGTENTNIYWQAADGTGTAERLADTPNIKRPTSFSLDGKWLVAESLFVRYDLGIVNLEGERRAKLLLNAPFNEQNGDISPDGRWLAYQSNESGRDEVYVRPFPEVNTGRWQISTGGGTRPLWARAGGELFYYIPPGRVMAVPVRPGATFTAGKPQVVVDGQYWAGPSIRTYDVSPDGKRFLMVKETPEATRFVVVLNWFEELKRLVPTNSKN